MKMMSSTSITSTSGMTLISASVVDDAPARADGGRRRSELTAMTFGIALGEVAFGDVQELEREVVHLRREALSRDA